MPLEDRGGYQTQDSDWRDRGRDNDFGRDSGRWNSSEDRWGGQRGDFGNRMDSDRQYGQGSQSGMNSDRGGFGPESYGRGQYDDRGSQHEGRGSREGQRDASDWNQRAFGQGQGQDRGGYTSDSYGRTVHSMGGGQGGYGQGVGYNDRQGWNDRQSGYGQSYGDRQGNYGQGQSQGQGWNDRQGSYGQGQQSQSWGGRQDQGFGGQDRNMGMGEGGGQRTGRGPKGYKRSDERIREDICDRLAAHGEVDAGEVDVQVSEGEVTLTGTVTHKNDKRLIEQIAEFVQGVQEVHNQLRMQRSSSQRTSDSSSDKSADKSVGDKSAAAKSGTSTATPTATTDESRTARNNGKSAST